MTTKELLKRAAATDRLFEKLVGPLTFARIISSTRLCEEMSQVEFAKILGISKQYLCAIEKGRKGVSPEQAAAFARKLGYSETQYVQMALQDQIGRAGLKMTVSLTAGS